MPETTVAELIIAQIKNAGVKRFYSLIGDSLNAFGQAVSKSSIEWIAVRHEEFAAFAAAGEAFVSGQICVCAGTAGPGSAHLVNGLYEANANHTPVLAIVTHLPASEIGFDYFQETHPLLLFQDCSVYCEMLTTPEQLPRLTQAAMQAAISKQGVAVLVVPGDVAKQKVSCNLLCHAPVTEMPRLCPNEHKVQALADILNGHKKIVLYCGYGCKNAMPQIQELCTKINSPIAYTVRAKEFVEVDNPFAVGMNGYLAWGSADYAMQKADCLVLLGTDFPYQGVIPTSPTVVQIDSCGAHIGRRSRLDLGIVSDVAECLKMVSSLIKPKEDKSFLQESVAFAKQARQRLENELQEMSSSPAVRPEYLTSKISEYAAEDAIFVLDVGLNDIWGSRYLQATKNRRIIGSFRHGTMAAALGEGFGASFLNRNRQVVVLAGDGGLSMLLGDLLTLKTHQSPIKIIVYNNQELGFIKMEAKLEGYQPFAIGLDNPDFAKIGEAIGLKSYSIKTSQEVPSVLQKAFSQSGPVLVNVWTDKEAIGHIGAK